MNRATSDSQIDKPQGGHAQRAELPDVNINTGTQSINTERTSLTTGTKEGAIVAVVLLLLHLFLLFLLFSLEL